MPAKPITPAPCPKCGTNMGPHCVRTTPKNGGPKARACGWAICPKPECRTVIRLRDKRILPAPSETSK